MHYPTSMLSLWSKSTSPSLSSLSRMATIVPNALTTFSPVEILLRRLAISPRMFLSLATRHSLSSFTQCQLDMATSADSLATPSSFKLLATSWTHATRCSRSLAWCSSPQMANCYSNKKSVTKYQWRPKGQKHW